MTRFRLAAIAAIALGALFIATAGGEAEQGNVAQSQYDLEVECDKTVHTDKTDDARMKAVAKKRRRGGGRRGGASALVPVKGAKVVTKMRDLTTDDGNNVIEAKDSDRTNDNGVAKTSHEFNNFGNYKVKAKLKVDGDVVATDTDEFGVYDRETGACGPAIGPG
jgi:hypothetical protein